MPSITAQPAPANDDDLLEVTVRYTAAAIFEKKIRMSRPMFWSLHERLMDDDPKVVAAVTRELGGHINMHTDRLETTDEYVDSFHETGPEDTAANSEDALDSAEPERWGG